eukprot:TRINITY_DN14762_c0_g1_i1.p1 TRINITY_DN14762_c0_g1~~TRINITY_DN14762_c0_g1_i1.p1  ORF type:complete len:405 (+),score=31.59 TRINITY_DN14762_c0_g1_i1:1199-2413(+)
MLQPSTSERSMLSIASEYFLKNGTDLFDFIDVCLMVDFEKWYEEIKKETFETIFLPLSWSELKAVTFLSTITDKRNGEVKQNIPEEHMLTISTLEKRIDDACQKLGGKIFCKLNTRSPKDCAYYPFFKKSIDELNKSLDKSFQDIPIPQPEEDKELSKDIKTSLARSFLRAIFQSLSLTDGKSAISLLTLSKRIYIDLSFCLGRQRYIKNCPVLLVLRRWVEIEPAFEFRGFVHNKKLTALSQYYSLFFFPELLPLKDQIQKFIQDYFKANILSKVSHDYYCIDFAFVRKILPTSISNSTLYSDFNKSELSKWLDGDSISNFELKVIELNPFASGTGTCLFKAKEKRDLRILCGEEPFEFRIVEQDFSEGGGFDTALSKEWQNIIKTLLKNKYLSTFNTTSNVI